MDALLSPFPSVSLPRNGLVFDVDCFFSRQRYCDVNKCAGKNVLGTPVMMSGF
jgi:hypothetical protein